MDAKIKRWKSSRNIIKLMQLREHHSEAGKILQQQTQFSDNFVRRLGLVAELEGHQGCVNCLEWSTNGLYLASGSDDTNIILWDPFRRKRLDKIPTPHIGNIFSVKFLVDDVMATASGDCRVIVQSVSGAKDNSTPLLDCSCHEQRVKRLATAPDQRTLFWSAGEDGLVVQHDMREPHKCTAHSKVLLDLSSQSEIKCIAVNPTKPHYVAVGANDCFVRLYDRRMLKMTSMKKRLQVLTPSARHTTTRPSPECVQFYAAGHLVKENYGTTSVKLAVTYIAFNSAGSEMLANVGGEQIYLFDVNNERHINELRLPQHLPRAEKLPYQSCCKINELVSEVEASNSNSQECACFYMRRAGKYFQRKWMSDLYGAARDYLHVIQHWPDHKQAYLGLIKCLVALNWEMEARMWLKHFLKIHSDSVDSSQVKFLRETLQQIKKPDEDEVGVKKVDDEEKYCRLDSLDFERRFVGHCNNATDIKEANFLGEEGNYICAGSDEGLIFVWNKKTTEIVTALFGDNSIVNCVQPHPRAGVLASSGIDTAVKIWSPFPEEGTVNSRIVRSIAMAVENNQQRMSLDPFESMLASMGYHTRNSAFDRSPIQELPSCRTS